MWGDSVKDAIDIINNFVASGNTLYLWNEQNEEQTIKVDKDNRIKFAALSELIIK